MRATSDLYTPLCATNWWRRNLPLGCELRSTSQHALNAHTASLAMSC